MRMTAFTRTVIVPLSLVPFAVAGLSAPAETFQSVLAVVAIGAIGFIVLGRASRAYRSRRTLALAPIDPAAQFEQDDASALARMESDAG